jgi:hypothetical protein
MCTVCGCSDTKGHDHSGIPMTTGIPTGMTTGIPTGMSMTTTTGTGIITTITTAATCISAPAPPASMWPGMSQERLIEIETDILSKNDRYAAENGRFSGAGRCWR